MLLLQEKRGTCQFVQVSAGSRKQIARSGRQLSDLFNVQRTSGQSLAVPFRGPRVGKVKLSRFCRENSVRYIGCGRARNSTQLGQYPCCFRIAAKLDLTRLSVDLAEFMITGMISAIAFGMTVSDLAPVWVE